MTSQVPDSTGRFAKKSIVRLAVEVDCSTWGDQAPGALWTTGRFVKPLLVRPAVAVDSCDWSEKPTDRAAATANDIANGTCLQHGPDRHLIGESVNEVLVLRSTHRQLDELEGEQLANIARERGANALLLNLTEVDFVSASFIASIVRVQQHMQSVGGKFAVSNLSGQVQEVFSLLQLERVLSIYSNQQQALQTD